jgi:hypothetical protein
LELLVHLNQVLLLVLQVQLVLQDQQEQRVLVVHQVLQDHQVQQVLLVLMEQVH